VVDYFIKLLSSKIDYTLFLDAFRAYYATHGIATDPVGGEFLYGQLYFYFNFASVGIVFFISMFFAKQKELIERNGITFGSILMPIVFLILPRQYNCLLPKTCITVILIYICVMMLLNKRLVEERA
jgi:hypothetical protein